MTRQVTIERLGHQGDGVASGPVFVPRTLPGEIVEGEVQGERMVLPKIVTPSADRVGAPCRHFKGCGGCSLQHASDAFVLDWKVSLVATALAARDLPAPIRNVHVSPPQSRRRATFSGRRTKSGATVGFHAPASDSIREIPDCILLRPALIALLPQLQELVGTVASRKGELRLSVTETDTGLDVVVTGGRALDAALLLDLTQFADRADLGRLTWEDETIETRRPPVLSFGEIAVAPPPGSFLQATREGEIALQGAVRDALGSGASKVVDLFAGCGTFSLPTAGMSDVHAVEGDARMLGALDKAWRHGAELRQVTTESRDLFRRPLMPDELARFDAVIIDPPRAGAEAQTQELSTAQVSRIAFVSCNPITFARDAALLTEAGYSMSWIDVVDQFRWSPHVELAALFQLT